MSDTLFFVTNRSTFGRGFGPPPSQANYDAISYGEVPVQPSSAPGVSGRMLGPPLVAGSDTGTSSDPDPGLVNFLAHALQAARAAGRTPMVVVHGYCYSFQDAVIRKADVVAWLASAATPVRLTPVLFTWPSINGLSVDNYLSDRQRAEESNYALARFIIAFEAAWEASGRPRCVYLAHSMGAWVSQNGMAFLAQSGHHVPAGMFDQAVVIAGDADTSAAEPGQGLDELARISRWLSLGVNRADPVVNLDGQNVLHRPRLGSSGPANVSLIPANARVVDYTLAVAADQNPIPPGETTWNYTGHQYYRTIPRVRDDLALALGGRDPDLVPNRFTSAQMVAAGNPFIEPGRLYVAPYVGAPKPPQDIDNPDRRG